MFISFVAIVITGLVFLFQEPLTFIALFVEVVCFIYFRHRFYDDDFGKGSKPVHRPRHPPAKTPSRND